MKRTYITTILVFVMLLGFVPQQPAAARTPAAPARIPAAAPADEAAAITAGLGWLRARQHSDGAWVAGAPGLTLRDTAAAAAAFAAARQRDAAFRRALAWLGGQTPRELDLQARALIARSLGGAVPPGARPALAAAQLRDGAWGDTLLSGQGNPVDTALALHALAGDSQAPLPQALPGLSFLIQSRHSDGGWRLTPERPSLLATATVLIAAGQYRRFYNLAALADPAVAWLLTQRKPDGSFGQGSGGTAVETALAHAALWSVGHQDAAVLEGARAWLVAAQAADGSWGGDAYATALAVEALGQRAITGVSGTVVNGFNNLNTPVAGATISLTTANMTVFTATTDIDGAFLLTDVPAGRHTLSVAAEGFYEFSASVRVTAGQTTHAGELALEIISSRANFNWSANPAVMGQTIYFTSTSDLAEDRTVRSYRWSTSASASASARTPTWSYRFTTPGTFDVTLLIHDSADVTSSVTHRIVVAQPPPASSDPNQAPITDFYVYGSVCHEGQGCYLPPYLTMRDGTSNPWLKWKWGDGQAETAFGSTQTHTFQDNGVYNVTLDVLTTKGLTGTVTKPVTVNNRPPTADMGANRSINLNEETIVQGVAGDPSPVDIGLLDMSWDFGDGTTATPRSIAATATSLSGMTSHTWTAPGTYTVTLTVRDKDGGQATDTAIYTVSQANLPPRVEPQPTDLAIWGVPFAAQIQASDPEGTALTYTLVQSPPGMTVDAAGLIRWTPASPITGLVPVDVRVADAAGKWVVHQFAVTVLRSMPTHDLVVRQLDATAVGVDPQTLAASGPITLTIQNAGPITVTQAFAVTLFDDTDQDGGFGPGDTILGQFTVAEPVAAKGSLTLSRAISGRVAFRDNLIYALVDSGGAVNEGDMGGEDNNLGHSSRRAGATYASPKGLFVAEQAWRWKEPTMNYDVNAYTLMHTPVAPFVDTNGDGAVTERDVPVVVVSGNVAWGDNFATVLRADTGRVVCDIRPFDVTGGGAGSIPMSIGDLEGDGKPELAVIYGSAANKPVVRVFNNDCSDKWRYSLTGSTDPDLRQCQFNPSNTYVQIADLDGDRRAEIIAGNNVFNADGTRRFINKNQTFSWWGSFPCFSLAADPDLDGQTELIYGNRVMLRGADGSVVWDRSLTDSYGKVAVANFDADPYGEIVFSGRYENQALCLEVREHDGALKWSVAATLFTNGSDPMIADVNLDGTPDVVVSIEPNTTLRAYSGIDGSVIWSRSFPTQSAPSNPPTGFDFDNDGVVEIVYRDETNLYILNSFDATTRWSTPEPSVTVHDYPIITDGDLDGHADIILTSGYDGIAMYRDRFRFWQPARTVMNQADYSITHINSDSSVPQSIQPQWFTSNTTRVQVQPDVMPDGPADLTVSYLRLSEARCPGGQTVIARVGNGGGTVSPAGVKVALYVDSVAASKLVASATITRALEPGQYVDLPIAWPNPPAGLKTLIVEVNGTTSTTTIPEARKDNNTHSRQVQLCDAANHAPAFTTTPPLTVTAGLAYQYPAAASDPDGDALSVTLLAGPAGASLPPASGRVVWAPAAADEGEHAFTLLVSDDRGLSATQTWTVTVGLPGPVPPAPECPGGGTPGAPELPGNGIDDDCNPATPDTIPSGAVAAAVRTDRRAYTAHETIQITGVISHSGAGTLGGLQAVIAVRGAGGELQTRTIELPPLGPGGALPVSDRFATGTTAPGALQVTLTVVAGGPLATAQADVTLTSSAGSASALSGALTVTPASVPFGGTFTVAWNAQNTGNAALSGVPFALLVVDPATGQLLKQQTVQADVATGATVTRTATFAGINHSGPALVVLQADGRALASGGVTLNGAAGRTLIYLPSLLKGP